jgi:hypothetical protein
LPVDWVPLVALLPDQPPEAVQLVASVVLQVSVEDAPLATEVGLAASVTVGAGRMVTVADWAADPPGPVQVNVKVVAAVRLPVDWVPLVPLVPDQPPEAVQVVVSVVFQVSVEAAPLTTDVGLAASVTVGTGRTVTVADSVAEPPGPVQARV